MMHEDLGILRCSTVIEMEQWCTRGLAEDDDSLLVH